MINCSSSTSSKVICLLESMDIFKTSTVEQRRATSDKIRAEYPDRIPIIVLPESDKTPAIDRSKMLVHGNTTAGRTLFKIRENIPGLEPEQALYAFCNNTLVPSSMLMSQVYAIHKDPNDNFLYITYALENTFG